MYHGITQFVMVLYISQFLQSTKKFKLLRKKQEKWKVEKKIHHWSFPEKGSNSFLD